jgi:hypothetical protein
MGLIKDRSRGTAPFKMLIFGLVLIAFQAYLASGSGAAEFMVAFSLKKLLIQVPAGIIAVWIASRFIDFDFGTIGRIALQIAGITVLAEGVACWIPIPFFSIVAEVTVMILGFFLLFELTKWQTYFIVLLNFVVLFGAHYLMANFINPSRSFGSRPSARLADLRSSEPAPPVLLCDQRERALGDNRLSRSQAPTRGSTTERLVSVDVGLECPFPWMG